MTTKTPIKTKQQVKKTSKKYIKEVEFQASDRIELVEQANRFIEHMVMQRAYPKLANAVCADVELTTEENITYNSALSFLKRQFDMGYKEMDIVDKKIETEESQEHN